MSKISISYAGAAICVGFQSILSENQWSLVEKWRVNCCPNQGKSSSEHMVDGKIPQTFRPNNQFISRGDGMRQDLSVLRKADELAGESGQETYSGIISRAICER